MQSQWGFFSDFSVKCLKVHLSSIYKYLHVLLYNIKCTNETTEAVGHIICHYVSTLYSTLL